MPSRFSLHVNIVLTGTLDRTRNILRVIGAKYGRWDDGDVEVEWLDPEDLVERIGRERDALGAAIANSA